jgi:hypothetical protein
MVVAPLKAPHNVRCAERVRQKAAEKLGFSPDHKGTRERR